MSAYVELLQMRSPKEVTKSALCFSQLPDSEPVHEIINTLHPEEYSFYRGLAFEKRRKSYLLGRFAAKNAIAAIVQEKNLETILIRNGIFSQPLITHKHALNVQVSITHCDNFGAAIVFAETHPMGIDIECVDGGRNKVIESLLTEGEKTAAGKLSCSYDITLALFWSAKEALSKVFKTGLLAPLTVFELSAMEARKEYFSAHFKNFTHYQTCLFCLGRHVCAIVYPRKTELQINIDAVRKWKDSPFVYPRLPNSLLKKSCSSAM